MEVPIRYDEAPFGTRFFRRGELDLNEIDSTGLDNQSKILILYNRRDRILFLKTKNSNGEVERFEYHSKSPTLTLNHIPRRSKKFEKGMEADDHFEDIRLNHLPCNLCARPAITLNENPPPTQMSYAKYLMSDQCWEKYILANSDKINDEKIMWMDFDCKGFKMYHSEFVSNDGKITSANRELLIDYYVQYNNRLQPCSNCDRIARLPHVIPCSIPCPCGETIVRSCCGRIHPPVPCRILNRWNLVRVGDEDADDLMKLLARDPTGNPCPCCQANNKVSVTARIAKCEECHFRFCSVCQKMWNGNANHDHTGPETFLKNNVFRIEHDFCGDFQVTSETYKRLSREFMTYTNLPTHLMAQHREELTRRNINVNANIRDELVDARIAKFGEFYKDILNILVFNFYAVYPKDAKPRNRMECGEAEPGTLKNGNTVPEKSESGTSKPGTSKTGDTRPQKSEPGSSKNGNTKSGKTVPGNSKPGSSKAGNPGTSKSGIKGPEKLEPGTSETGSVVIKTWDPKDVQPFVMETTKIFDLLNNEANCVDPNQPLLWLEELITEIDDLEVKIRNFMNDAAEDFRSGDLRFKV